MIMSYLCCWKPSFGNIIYLYYGKCCEIVCVIELKDEIPHLLILSWIVLSWKYTYESWKFYIWKGFVMI